MTQLELNLVLLDIYVETNSSFWCCHAEPPCHNIYAIYLIIYVKFNMFKIQKFLDLAVLDILCFKVGEVVGEFSALVDGNIYGKKI